jgi:hypothetical protein
MNFLTELDCFDGKRNLCAYLGTCQKVKVRENSEIAFYELILKMLLQLLNIFMEKIQAMDC